MSDHIHGPGCGHPMGSWEKSSEVAASRLADAVRQNIIAAVRLQSGRITADEFDATTREVHAALQAFDAALAAPAADGLDVERLRNLARSIRSSDLFRRQRRSLLDSEKPTWAQIVALVDFASALHEPSREPTYIEGERLDRPGNRANLDPSREPREER